MLVRAVRWLPARRLQVVESVGRVILGRIKSLATSQRRIQGERQASESGGRLLEARAR